MKIPKLFSGFLACFLYFSLAYAYQSEIGITLRKEQKPATIKVLIHSDSSGFLFEARGRFQVIDPANGVKLSSGRKGKRFYLYPHEEGIKWGENFLGIFQLHIVPNDAHSTLLVNGMQYRGIIEVYHVEGKLNVINEISVEDFLKCTLPHNFPFVYPPSVMDAVAIIARTDAYYKALFSQDSFWHVDAKKIGYEGMGLIHQNLTIERAIDDTRHLVMTFEDQPFPATWTEHCGGKTAPYQTIFRESMPTPQGVDSAFATKEREDTHWAFDMNTQDLAKVAKVNRITGIDLFVDHFSNKVYALRIHDGAHIENMDFLTLQKYIGKHKLKSNDFKTTIKGNIASFEGYGIGTGVGLCLYSAAQMADCGNDMPHILAAFFPHTHIEKMRTYPESIISTNRGLFFLPKHKKTAKKKRPVLH